MSNYSKTTNFATKDALASGNPLKTIKGTEFNVEFDAIEVASATKANIAAPTFTGVPSAPTASVGTDTTQIATTAFANASATAAAATALPKSGGAMTGAITTNSTFDGRDVAADGVTADAALPKSGGAMTGAITTNSTFDGRDVAADGVTADAALPKAGGAMTGAITTNSTFDGRDVGTDGTKLDTVATNANNYTLPSTLPASMLTGALPAISGASLTDLPAGGNIVEFIASGTLPNGGVVLLKANGEVEAITGSGDTESIPLGSKHAFTTASDITKTSIAFDPNNANKFIVSCYFDGSGAVSRGRIVAGSVSGSSITFGSVVEFRNNIISTTCVTFDPNTANKFLLVYKDSSNNNYGTCKVGTLSGTTISLGSAIIFRSSPITIDTRCAAFDPNTANLFLIAYSDNNAGNTGVSVQGTISGTSISFRNPITFDGGSTSYVNLSFDPNTSTKFVVSYKDAGNSEHGTAIVGTFGPDYHNYGTEVVFNAAASDDTFVTADPNNANKYIITYLDQGNSNYGTAIIGTVSGTSISFGSEYVYNSAQVVSQIHAADPSNSGKFVVVYKDVGNSSLLAAREGTVSGTTISYGTEIVWNGGYGGDNLDIAFDPNTSGKFAISYRDFGSTSGSIMLGQISTVVTNLTATNFLGTSTAAYTNGQTAEIMLQGGVSTNQSSLAIGSTYYVQTNGTLATSAGNPSVEAGKAVSATTLLLKGI